MNPLDRREFLKTAGLLAASAGFPRLLAAADEPAGGAPLSPTYEWIRNPRIVIAEGYNPPFYPAFDYVPAKAVDIAQRLGGDALRYPAASYYAFFPTKSGYPVHPELKGDPMAETVELCRARGLKCVAYLPLNHPFMDTRSKDPRYAGWRRQDADGTPITTEHYGYATYYEGCLNSPLRGVITELVREALTNYPVDVIFFDGPYQGMQNAKKYCHCPYCEAAYRRRFGRPVPDQAKGVSREEQVRYTEWMANEIVIGFLQDLRGMIRRTRDVPVLFNDTSLLSRREWRSRAVPVADGFMFEAAETPEDKLFNMELGHSTDRIIWTYVGTHTQYNREHLEDERVRGWFSYPVEGPELLLDGATALAGGAGIVYWSMSRFFYEPQDPLAFESGRHVKEIFDFQRENDALLRRLRSAPKAGILVGAQTIDWYSGKHFVGKAYENYYHGAFKLLKAHSVDSRPFLDWQMSPEKLAQFALVYAPNAVCLSDRQCAMLADYVRGGGRLVATHLTSAADEHGKVRPDFGLADLFGASLEAPEPVEIPDLYLHPAGSDEVPQDPQVVRFRATSGQVVAETFDRGHRRIFGPAIVRRTVGQGEVIYIGSGLEAIYEETLMTSVRDYLGKKLLGAWLAPLCSYQLDFQPGLMGQLVAAPDTLVLHLLADTGNKNKHLRSREWFLPVPEVKARIRIPEGRRVRAVRLMRSGRDLPTAADGGWLDVAIPEVLIHEAVRVDLA